MCPGFFIGVDIEVLISEFVVVAILSEWWSVLTTVDHIPVCVCACVCVSVCVCVCVCVCVVTGSTQSAHTSGKNGTSVTFVRIYMEIWIHGTDVRHSQNFKSKNLLITYKCFWMCFHYANNYHSSLLTLHIRLVSMFIM